MIIITNDGQICRIRTRRTTSGDLSLDKVLIHMKKTKNDDQTQSTAEADRYVNICAGICHKQKY